MATAGGRVVLIEDQTIFREMLAEVLSATLGCKVCAEFSSGRAALEELPSLPCELVILDAILPDISGLAVLEELQRVRRGLPVIMVTAYPRPQLVQGAVQRGARGFVTKGTPLAELTRAVDRVMRGGRYFCSETSELLAEAIHRPPNEVALSPRQREILKLVAQGRSSKQIAEELGISLKTVSNHRHSLREKLQPGDIATLTRYAIEQGLVEPTP